MFCKRISILIFTLIFYISANSQVQQPTSLPTVNNINGWYNLRGVLDSMSMFIERDTNFTAKYPTLVKATDHNFYYTNGNGNHWYKLVDTAGHWISSGWLPTILKYYDTASMLSSYKTVYPRNAVSGGVGINYNASTGVITNSSPSTGGTVTSVATNNNTGITGGTITTSGTLAIDTTVISTRLWRQKGIDSVSANVNLKVNISDTANMLANYRNGIIALNADTVYQAAQIAARVKYTDTSSMLSPYQRSLTAVKYSDTASMLANYRTGIIALNADTVYQAAQIAARVKYTDTASMLNNYLNGIISLNSDSSYQAGQIAARVKYTDTSSMLSPYARTTALGSYVKYTDTASMLSPYGRLNYINTQLATKVNYTDTASMLSPYYRTATANAALALKVNYTDTASMLNNYLNGIIALNSDTIYQAAQIAARVKYSDTAAMLAPYTRSVSGGYLPLSGGTLTGNLNGTTANFTGFVSANGFQSAVTGVAGGSTTNMTSSSSQNWYITSGAPTTTTIVLPNATTIAIGNTYQFNNNATGGLSIQQYGGGALYTVPSGGYVEVILLSNSFSAGQWDVHVFFPTNTTAGTSGFSTTGTINSSGLDTYTSNLGSSYTSRTKIDKNYVDSSRGVDVKYSDTASMLNNYRTGIIALNADTATIQPRFNNVLGVVATKVNYTDTASMLNNYRTGIVALNADTATIQPRFNNVLGVTALKVNYTDTASMLAGYKTFYPRNAISLTTTGTSGAATYTTSTGVLNIPQYQSVLTNPITGTGTTNYLSKFTGTSTLGNSLIQDDGNGVVTMSSNSGYDINLKLNNTSQTNSLIFYQNAGTNKFGHGIISSGDWWLFWQAPALTAKMAINKTTGNLLFNKSTDNGVSAFQVSGSINQSSVTSSIIKADANGTLVASSAGTDYQAPITLTTTGTSGAATFSSNTLNIPQYQAAGTYVTSVTGTSPISSSGGTTPAISISQATTSSNGYLSSTDWNTFNNKQNALTNPVTGTGTTGQLTQFTGSSTIGNSTTIQTTSYGITVNAAGNILFAQASSVNPTTGYNMISGDANGIFFWLGSSLNRAYFNISGLTAGRNYILPDATGTLALTSSISGTANYVPKFTSSTAIGNSIIQDDGSQHVSINYGTNPSAYTLDVNGTGRFTSTLSTTGGSIQSLNSNTSGYSTLTVANTGASGKSFDIGVGGNTSGQANRFYIYDNTAAALRFYIDGSTGAATFSSSVTTNNGIQDNAGYITSQSSTTAYLILNSTYPTTGKQYQISSGGTDGSFRIYDATSSAFRMFINSSGNVGIGTTSPLGKLNVSVDNNDANSGQLILNGSSNTNQRISIGYNTTLSYGFISSYTALSGYNPLVFQPNGGNVGIGTTSFYDGNTKFQVTKAGYSRNIFQNSNDGTIFGIDLYDNTYGINIGAVSNHFLGIYTNSAERMRITSGGNVLIGTTTDNGNKLQVNGNITLFTANTRISSDGNGEIGINYGGAGTSTYSLAIYNGTTRIGGVNSTTGIYVALSDVNKKKDFETSTIGLNEILNLKPTLYRMKSEDESVPKTLGFIAQEVKPFIPQAYVENDGFIGLNDRPIIAALVKAVQELQQEIQDLKKQIKN